MPHTPYALTDEFPAHKTNPVSLNAADAHIANLVAAYDAVNLAVYRAEARLDVITVEDEQHLRRARGVLKNQIWARDI